jgi:hypothetical protein
MFAVNIEALINMRPNEYLFCDGKILILNLSIIYFSINLCVGIKDIVLFFSCLQILFDSCTYQSGVFIRQHALCIYC